MFEAAEVKAMLAERDQRLDDLTKELDRLGKDSKHKPLSGRRMSSGMGDLRREGGDRRRGLLLCQA